MSKGYVTVWGLLEMLDPTHVPQWRRRAFAVSADDIQTQVRIMKLIYRLGRQAANAIVYNQHDCAGRERLERLPPMPCFVNASLP